MADFISGVIGQLGRPTVSANQFDGLGKIGADVINQNQQQGQDQEAQYIGAMLNATPEQRQMILAQGTEAGVFDEDDSDLASNFEQYAPEMVSFLQVNGYEKLLPESYRDNGRDKSPASVKETEWYMNQPADVQQAHMKLKRGLQLTPDEKLAYERALAQIKAEGKGDEVTAIIGAEAAGSDAAADTAGNKAKAIKLQEAAVNAATSAQSTFKTLKGANRIYDKAISAIDEGAESGAFAKILPTIRSETLELQNAIREAGLNTISGVTLGAISKSELDLALAVDIPEGMDEKDLKPYLQKKKAANIKLMKELNKMSSFLSKSGNTVAMWNEKWGGETDLGSAVSGDQPMSDEDILNMYLQQE